MAKFASVKNNPRENETPQGIKNKLFYISICSSGNKAQHTSCHFFLDVVAIVDYNFLLAFSAKPVIVQ